MKEKNISSLQIKNNQLTIEYSSDNPSQTISEKELDSNWQEVYENLEEVLKEKNLQRLSLSEIQTLSSQNKPTDYLPWIIGISILILGIIGLVIYFVRKNNQEREII